MQIETAMTAFADGNLTGLLVLPDALTVIHLEQIVKLAMHLRLPAIYPYRMFAGAGGLVSYGVNVPEHAGQAATYIDRILKGEQPGTLPVQAPTKFELVVHQDRQSAQSYGATNHANDGGRGNRVGTHRGIGAHSFAASAHDR